MARWRTGRLIPGLVVVAISAVSVVAASVFADRSQAERVAIDGMIIGEAEQVRTAAAGVRANLGFLLVLAAGEVAGVEDGDDVAQVAEELRADVEELTTQAGRLDAATGGGDHFAGAVTATAGVEEVLTLIERADTADDVDAAGAVAGTRALSDLRRLESSAGAEARDAAGRIDAERSRAGDAAWLSSMIVALIVPGLAVAGAWLSWRRRAERQALRAEAEKNLALVRSRDELIAGLSHQLRTPLTAIVGYTEAILDTPDDLTLRVEGLGTIRFQADELTRMVDDLLVMARLESGPVAIERRAVDAAREIEAAIGGVTAEVSLLPGLVMADRLRLRHILKNLVSNAAQHGGPTIIVRSGPVGHTYRIVVADDGPGLDQERLATLFEPYVHSARAALVTGSLGLGLAVAKQLAGQMGCDLRYQRNNGYTLFVLDLPMADSAVSAESSAGSRPDVPRTGADAR